MAVKMKRETNRQLMGKRVGLKPGFLSLRFNGHFPDGSGLAGTRMSPFWILLELRMMDVLPVTQSTVSEH